MPTAKEPKPIFISDFQKGISPSPLLGFSDMRNIDNWSVPGVAKINASLQGMFATGVASQAIDINTTTDVFSFSNTYRATQNASSATGRAVKMTASVFPTVASGAALDASTIYYLIDVSATTAKLARSVKDAQAGTYIDFTSTGTTVALVTVDKGQIMQICKNNTPLRTEFFALDENGRVWTTYGATSADWLLVDGNTLTNAGGNGLIVWKKYLIVFRNAAIDVCDISTAAKTQDPIGSTSWTNGWQTMSQGSGDNNTHYPLISNEDGSLYFCNRDSSYFGYIGSIVQKANQTFAPADSATYTYNEKALKFAQGISPAIIEELRTDLVIGTTESPYLFTWDKYSTSWSAPIRLPESGIKGIVNINNLIYLFVGSQGNVYVSNGVSAQLEFSIPDYLTGSLYSSGGTTILLGQAIQFNGDLLFSVGGISLTCGAVWRYSPTTKNLIICNEFSNASYSNQPPGKLCAINSTTFYASWKNGTTYNIDTQIINGGNVVPYGNYSTYIETPLYLIGTPLEKNSLSLEMILTKPLNAGDGIRIKYRNDIVSAYTTLKTIDYTTAGASSGLIFLRLPDAFQIQIKIELTATGSGPYSSPEIRTLRLSSYG